MQDVGQGVDDVQVLPGVVGAELRPAGAVAGGRVDRAAKLFVAELRIVGRGFPGGGVRQVGVTRRLRGDQGGRLVKRNPVLERLKSGVGDPQRPAGVFAVVARTSDVVVDGAAAVGRVGAAFDAARVVGRRGHPVHDDAVPVVDGADDAVPQPGLFVLGGRVVRGVDATVVGFGQPGIQAAFDQGDVVGAAFVGAALGGQGGLVDVDTADVQTDLRRRRAAPV